MTDLASRIKIAADRVGGLKWLSERIDVPRRTLGNWLTGTNPKPAALQAIAKVTGVSLDWLMTGEGDPDDDGFAISMRRLQRSNAADIASSEAASAEFDEVFSRVLRAAGGYENDAKRREPDTAPVRRKVLDLVRSAHHAAGITLRQDDLTIIAMDVFATLTQRVRDMNDGSEVDLVLSHLMHNLQRELEDAKSEPGTGKHSAS